MDDDRSPIGPHSSSPADLKARIEAERLGQPFLLYKDGLGTQHIITLPESGTVVLGRRKPECDVALDWDKEVSRVHARLEKIGGDWTLVDDGISRNGSWIKGERVTAHRRLRDRDTMRFGATLVAYLQPGERDSEATVSGHDPVPGGDLTEAERKVLLALARPFKDPDPAGMATPATNKEIAKELNYSVDTVKGHLRKLFEKFGVQDLQQNQKRAQLVWRAFRSGAISATNLWE